MGRHGYASRFVKRLTVLLALLALAVPAPAAFAQADPFSPLPPAQTPTPEVTAAPVDTNPNDDGVSRETLAVILGAVIILFIAIGVFITRDARRSLPEGLRRDDPRLREEGPHRRPKQAKSKARAKTRAQKRARRANRPTR
jgi:hypothetical protein